MTDTKLTSKEAKEIIGKTKGVIELLRGICAEYGLRESVRIDIGDDVIIIVLDNNAIMHLPMHLDGEWEVNGYTTFYDDQGDV